MNVIEIKQKEIAETEGFIKITYKDRTSEIIQADSFGTSNDFSGFIVAFSDKSDIMTGLFNKDYIIKIEICDKENNENNS